MIAIEHVTNYLGTKLDAPIIYKIPLERPRTFIRIDQAAAKLIDKVADRTLVIIQAYAPTPTEAVDLLEKARRAMLAPELASLRLVWEENAGPAQFADPALANVSRWQLTGYLTSFLN